jgi:hypothetical protein
MLYTLEQNGKHKDQSSTQLKENQLSPKVRQRVTAPPVNSTPDPGGECIKRGQGHGIDTTPAIAIKHFV